MKLSYFLTILLVTCFFEVQAHEGCGHDHLTERIQRSINQNNRNLQTLTPNITASISAETTRRSQGIGKFKPIRVTYDFTCASPI